MLLLANCRATAQPPNHTDRYDAVAATGSFQQLLSKEQVAMVAAELARRNRRALGLLRELGSMQPLPTERGARPNAAHWFNIT